MPALPKWPTIAVVIPARNEESFIQACLESVLLQDYPPELVDIVVADGGSTDATIALVTRLISQHRRIRLIDNPLRTQAHGLNLLIAATTGPVIARLDAHGAWPPDHLSRSIQALHRTRAASVGGGMQSRGRTATGEAIARATRTFLGAGGARYRYASREQEVETVWLGCFRRGALEAAGLFNADLAPHEDFEMNQRIRRLGGRIVFVPELSSTYWTRDSWRGAATQYFRYGRAKVRANRTTPGLIRPYHLGPPALVGAVAAALVTWSWRPSRKVWWSLGTAYTAACAVSAALVGRAAPRAVRARIPLVFPVLQLSWGAGFWVELLRWRRQLRQSSG